MALEIQTDEYVRRIDLSHNKIPQVALKDELVNAMKHNESIVNMDLEGNIGFTAGIKHQLALCLMKNMEVYKANGQAVKSQWIDMRQIDVLDDEMKGLVQSYT